MSKNRSVGRSTSASKKNRSTNLCAFTFADGRQCRTPRCSGHLHLCYFHAQKEAESLAAQQVGKDIARFLPAKLLTACDLGVAMSRLFCAVAQGQIKPKVASTLAYLAQTMLQSIPIAQDEYIHSFDTNAWRREVRSSFNVPTPQPGPAPRPASQPAQQPTSAPPPPTPVEAGLVYPEPRREPGSSASSSSTSPTAPQPSAQPAPSPHTPLPPTSAEFVQQVLAGRNSSRSEISTQSRPGREPGPSDSSSSPAPSSDSAPARTSSTQSAPSSPSTLPTPNNSQPAPTPPARQPTSPQQSYPTQNSQHNSLPAPVPPAPPPVPPGFGAPANWDVLIPPKPRRRFSRHWHFLD